MHGDTKDWGLHVWGDTLQETEWSAPLLGTNDGDICAWEFEMVPDTRKTNFSRWVGLLVHSGEEKDAGGDMVEISDGAEEVWLLAGHKTTFYSRPDPAALPRGDLHAAAAHWVERNVIVWRVAPHGADGRPRSFRLTWSTDGRLYLTSEGVACHNPHRLRHHLPLQMAMHASKPAAVPTAVLKRFPHLAGCTPLLIPDNILRQVDLAHTLLRAQLAVSVHEADGTPVNATGVQLQGVLDQLFYYSGPLGAEVGANSVALRVWAPTAQQVTLLLWDTPAGGAAEEIAMTEERGVWSAEGPRAWEWRYYKFRVRVFSPTSALIETFEATDPYSRSLAADGARSQIVDLAAPELAPEGWADHVGPARLASPTDASIYELHVRDFSASDASVPAHLRGKFMAFAEQGTAGCRHLEQLAAAGLTHVHLLPSYDFGSVPERPGDQLQPEGDLASFAPDSEEQQAAVMAVADRDAFNWGYDPVHWGVPEGSYASDPDGPARVREFRGMVQALHGRGLRVVLDVVYNHTFHSACDGVHSPYAVLDKLVPGYYHRRTEEGDVCNSTCCNNTATEHAMAGRLVVDDLVHWARAYKVDGFRFDIMGHLLVSTMKTAQAALAAMTPAHDRIDGGSLYLYGEAWDFGEVACNQRGRNASQLNIGGTHLGSFNDRFRDALMGGSPFASPRYQGFATGLATAPNAFTQADMTPEQQRTLLAEYTDLLRLSLAGNLRDYELLDVRGQAMPGRRVLYNGVPAAYAVFPEESVQYAACHDNETLFDQVMLKAAEGTGVEERARMATLALACVCLAQGVAFFHAGDDILRSKSLDRDSYNSGDWFNRLDWSLQSNGFGAGLPPASKNQGSWGLHRPLLANPALRPPPELIALAKARFLELLRLRYSSPLLRLPRAEHIQRQLRFLNTGPRQVPGLVVMELLSADAAGHSSSGGVEDPLYRRLLCMINARHVATTADWPPGAQTLALHPLQAASADEATRGAHVNAALRTVEVPALTAAVFVEPR
ncbi:hypothetical protein WJX81_008597 [Elliptochloris bilobata]|uniref:Pullulanase n=1 Tax=Elliptochloris bilobata TaxID=381761 RepID=A0AAW1RFW1_9CHLO